MSVTLNHIGLPRDAYKGAATTLCAGCGHNSITNHLVKAMYELGIEPNLLAKMSGIGCSSKTPAYFVDQAHGFNGVHGRMPALTTGAQVANRKLILLGISGDGDSVSIGLGQFLHLIRRNVDCTYIIEDNGTYGLTKGQFSATADVGSVQKRGSVNTYQPIDPCALALTVGCSFVARSFSGDGKQLVPLIKAALAHRGTEMLDVSHLLLRKLGQEHDPSDRLRALRLIEEARERNQLLTGLLYVDESMEDFATRERLPERPLRDLGEDELRVSREDFEQLMAELA